jgi:hypothetical protein
MVSMDGYMRTHNLTELADMVSDVFPQVQNYLTELAAQLRGEGGEPAAEVGGKSEAEEEEEEEEVGGGTVAAVAAGNAQQLRTTVTLAVQHAHTVLRHLGSGRWGPPPVEC